VSEPEGREDSGPEDVGPEDAVPENAGPENAVPENAGPEEVMLEEELRALAAVLEPVPERLVQAAVDAYAWRTVDADLAELVFDSLGDSQEAALVRGGQGERLLSFQAASLTIEVEVTATGPARRLIGQLVPPQRADVEIRHQDDVLKIATDDLGRFIADSLPAGPVSLRCSPAAGAGAAGAGAAAAGAGAAAAGAGAGAAAAAVSIARRRRPFLRSPSA
jgi:hypothetical protein